MLKSQILIGDNVTTYQENTTQSIDRQGKITCYLKWNSAENFDKDCTSFISRNDIITIVDL